jgi:hypothetical protein
VQSKRNASPERNPVLASNPATGANTKARPG